VSQYASEAGHYYWPDGRPAYTIVGANGKERNTTLRDARKLNLYPSVTTITGMAAAPGLERWKQEQVLLAALTLEKLSGESEADWVKRVWEDSKQQAKQAAERGTEIHGAIERSLQNRSVPPDLQPYVDAARDQLDRCFGPQDWAAEKSFAHPLGYGGKVDLHSPRVLVDFKTKDGPLTDLRLYDNHFMQLGAYAHGLNIESAICAIVFVRRDEPEAVTKMPGDTDMLRGWTMFQALLQYWQAKTGHRPYAEA
jgi:hypothetical protein